VEDAQLRARICELILPTILSDNVKARLENPDGSYRRAMPAEGQPQVRSQTALHSLARGFSQVIDQGGRRLFVPVLRRNGKEGKRETRRSSRPRRGSKGAASRKAPDEV
jgi:hypothetical protein